MKITLLLLVSLLTSCNSMFVAKTSKGSSIAYAGSFASKAARDTVAMTLPDGTRMNRETIDKDETDAIKVLANLALLKAGIGAATSTTNNAINAIPK